MAAMTGQSMPASCDVVVVGAGLVGALVARQLVEKSLSVVVLETQPHAGGMASHRPALALLGTPEPYAALVGRVGEQKALKTWLLTRRNLEIVAALAASFDGGLNRAGSFRPVKERLAAELQERSVRLLTREGFAVTLEDATEFGMLVGLQTQEDLTFDPAALVDALLDHPDIVLQADTEVQDLRSGLDDVEIFSRKHYMRAKAVVLASGAHTVRLNDRLAHALTVSPLHRVDCDVQTALPVPFVLDDGQVSIQDCGDFWELAACPDSPDDDPWELLSQTAAQYCPDAKMLRRYNGWVARSSDGLPLVGELPDLPHVYTVSGLGPWGFSWAFVAVEALIGLMVRDEDPGLLNLRRLLG